MFDMPPSANCNSHQPNKVNYSILQLNTRAKNYIHRGVLEFCRAWVAHTTSVLKADCSSFHWHIAKLPPNFAKRFWMMQANSWAFCNAKVRTNKHGTLGPINKGLKKEHHSTNNVEYEFWFFRDDIKHCVSGKRRRRSTCCSDISYPTHGRWRYLLVS